MNKADWSLVWECWDLVAEVRNNCLFKLAVLLQMLKEETVEMDARRVEKAQGYARLAIRDLERLDKALEARKGRA